MKNVKLDGLPGLTMQGKQGPTGKRGYTTFYNYSESFSENHIYNPEKDFMYLGAYDTNEDEIYNKMICIPTRGVSPIVHDRFVNREDNLLVLYEIINVLEWNNDVKDSFTNQKSVSNITSYLSRSLHYTYTETNVKSICILKKIDSLVYKINGNERIQGIEVKLNTVDVNIKSWNGTYSKTTIYKNPENDLDHYYNYDLVYYANRNYFLEDINKENFFSNYVEDTSKLILTGNCKLTVIIYDADTKEKLSNLDSTLSEISIFHATGPKGDVKNLIDDPTNTQYFNANNGIKKSLTEGLITFEIPSVTYFYNLLYLNINGYCIEYYILDKDDIRQAVGSDGVIKENEYYIVIYAVPELTGGQNDPRNKISVKEKYTLINTAAPLTKNIMHDSESDEDIEEDITDTVPLLQYEIFMPGEYEDREKIKIVAEFSTSKEKVYNMSTCRNKLWKGAETDEDYNSSYGLLKNYSYKLNFDNEFPGTFTLILKTFDEGNLYQTFKAETFVPAFLKEYDYTVELYAYYRATAAYEEKIYLGKGAFAATYN